MMKRNRWKKMNQVFAEIKDDDKNRWKEDGGRLNSAWSIDH